RVAADVQAERDDRGREGVDHDVQLRQRVEHDEQLDQQRRAPDDRDVPARRERQRPDRRDPGERDEEREHQAEHEADGRERQGRRDRGLQHRPQVPPDQAPGARIHYEPLTSTPKYCSEMRFSVPSARSSSRARLTSAMRPLSLRAANACSLVSPVVPATFTPASPCTFWYSATASESLTVASTRPSLSSWTACTKPSTASTSAPAPRATSAQLLVADCAVVLPARSARLVMSVLSARVTITPSDTVYGSERSYLALRSSLIATWLATRSNRPDSSPAKIASHGVCTNSTCLPSFSPTARAISTS